jgi:hypothetical protein
MRSVTVEQVLAWCPCTKYTEEEIRELAAGRDSLTVDDFATLPILIEGRLWCMFHEELIPERELRLLASDYAAAALRCEQEAGREPDQRSWNAVEMARRHARGEVGDEVLAAAWGEAAAAAVLAARAMGEEAWAAAWSAAWATSEAAGEAALAAAHMAVWAAARHEARAAARATGNAVWVVEEAAREAAWERRLAKALDAARAAGGE